MLGTTKGSRFLRERTEVVFLWMALKAGVRKVQKAWRRKILRRADGRYQCCCVVAAVALLRSPPSLFSLHPLPKNKQSGKRDGVLIPIGPIAPPRKRLFRPVGIHRLVSAVAPAEVAHES